MGVLRIARGYHCGYSVVRGAGHQCYVGCVSKDDIFRILDLFG